MIVEMLIGKLRKTTIKKFLEMEFKDCKTVWQLIEPNKYSDRVKDELCLYGILGEVVVSWGYEETGYFLTKFGLIVKRRVLRNTQTQTTITT